MGLEQVKQEVLQQGKVKTRAILKEAEKQAQEIKAKAKQEVAEYQKKTEKHTATLSEAMERKMLAAARLEAQRLLMNTKKELIEQVLERVREQIASLGEGERKRFLEKLLKAAQQEIVIDTVLVNKADLLLFKEEKIKVIATEISGGLLAQTEDGKVSVNLSLNELIEKARNDLLIKVSEVLFSQ